MNPIQRLAAEAAFFLIPDFFTSPFVGDVAADVVVEEYDIACRDAGETLGRVGEEHEQQFRRALRSACRERIAYLRTASRGVYRTPAIRLLSMSEIRRLNKIDPREHFGE